MRLRVEPVIKPQDDPERGEIDADPCERPDSGRVPRWLMTPRAAGASDQRGRRTVAYR